QAQQGVVRQLDEIHRKDVLVLFDEDLPVTKHHFLAFDLRFYRSIGREVLKSELRAVLISGDEMLSTRGDDELHVKRRTRVLPAVEVNTSLGGSDHAVVPNDLAVEFPQL